jgi:hypothetical protein
MQFLFIILIAEDFNYVVSSDDLLAAFVLFVL